MTTERAGAETAGAETTEADATASTGDETADAAEATYRVAVDLDACDGVFACLVRDDRFVEADDGLVGFDPDDAAGPVERTADEVAATFADGRVDEARAAAAACPLDAIAVDERDATAERDGAADRNTPEDPEVDA
jgi:ferredoxin